LAEIARSLGSDVPFLLSEYVSAVGRGRGDQLIPAEQLAGGVAIVVPEFAISTADAYRWLDQSRSGSPVHEETFHSWYSESTLTQSLAHTSSWTNDFEAVAEERYPELQRYRERLTALGARVARLSGSGSCVFGVFEGAVPTAADLAIDAIVLPTRTSSRVVQVEVVE
jgi:4-diphosphocytidyl-2-C-methyl-D-erythritol kinase